MIIYKGKNKNLKKIFQLCVLEYKHEDGRITEVKGFFHDAVRYAASWIEKGKEFSIKPCVEADLYETFAVTHNVNNAILVIQSNKEYSDKLEGFYQSIFEDVERMKRLSDFAIFWQIRTRYKNIKYIGSKEYGYFNGWIEEPEFLNLLALELLERFRDEYGGEDLGEEDENIDTENFSYQLHSL
jgi:hypothetical protein